ncbi:hypothetical protein [Allokutzneria oryzae]|uniref:Uncharacterized protein n=1 Tax=Allokutzneria oryzae TaxID=1378989 RepID=A0ABV5ZSG3_9PSEU
MKKFLASALAGFTVVAVMGVADTASAAPSPCTVTRASGQKAAFSTCQDGYRHYVVIECQKGGRWTGPVAYGRQESYARCSDATGDWLISANVSYW